MSLPSVKTKRPLRKLVLLMVGTKSASIRDFLPQIKLRTTVDRYSIECINGPTSTITSGLLQMVAYITLVSNYSRTQPTERLSCLI